jgi:glycosyl transferase family 25
MGKEKNLGIDHVYVVHAPEGYEEQKIRLINILSRKYDFDYEFMEKDQPDLVPQYFINGIEKEMSRGTIMCTLNHILFYRSTAENNHRTVLILEDDPFFDKHFLDTLGKIVQEAETLPKGFLISLENSTLEFPSYGKIKKGKYIYEADHGRCACAYLLDQTAACNIMERLKTKKCEKTIDHWHNLLADEGVFKIYWAHPPIVEQGSLNGKISSCNSCRRQGLSRRIKWLAEKYYKTYLLRFFK